MTPEYDVEEEETSCQYSYDKVIETPQMKAIRAKALQRLGTRDKSSPSSSEASCTKTVDNKKTSVLRNSSSKLSNDKSVTSRDKNDNKITFTPQMRVLYEKMEQRISNASNTNKTSKEDAKNKQQRINTTNQKSMKKIWEKQEKYTEFREDNTRNKGNIKYHNKNQNTQKLYGQNGSNKYSLYGYMFIFKYYIITVILN